MNTFLLAYLCVALTILVPLFVREQISAFRSRANNAKYQQDSLETQRVHKNATVATYARQRGLKRPDEVLLEEARSRAVVAGSRDEDKQSGHAWNGQQAVHEISHPTSVGNGSDV